MTQESPRGFPWRSRGRNGPLITIVLLACMGFFLLTAPAASAHDQLTSSEPIQDERVATAPSSITLRFSAPLLNLGNEIRIVDAEAKNWALGASVLTRETLSQPLAPDMPEGEYQVRWRVVSSDGHPINGAYSFLVGETAQSGTIADVVAPEQNASAPESPAAVSASTFAFPAWGLAALAGAGGGLVLYLIYLVLSSVRRRSGVGQD